MARRTPKRRTSERTPGTKPGRKKMIISFVVTVVVLAAVILVAAALSEPERTTTVGLPSLEAQAAQLYDDAMSKLASGDTTGALELLQEAAVLDPANDEVKDELETLTRRQEDDPDDGGDTGSTDDGGTTDPDPDPDPHAGFLDPVSDMTALLPAAVSGFNLGAASSDAALGIAQISLDPVPGGAYDQRVANVLVTVHDKETKAGAAEYLERASERLFPDDSQVLTVGDMEVYFGTDGGRGATATFYRGRYVFETILSADQDVASALSDVGEAIADAFPESLD